CAVEITPPRVKRSVTRCEIGRIGAKSVIDCGDYGMRAWKAGWQSTVALLPRSARRSAAVSRASMQAVRLPVRRTNRAEADLDEIWRWTAENLGVPAAERIVERIEAGEDRLGHFPEI